MRRVNKITVAAQCAAAMLLGGLYANHVAAQTDAIGTGAWEDPNIWDNGLPTAGVPTNIGANFTVTSTGTNNQSGSLKVTQDSSLLSPGDPGPTLMVTGGTISTLGGTTNKTETVVSIGSGTGQISNFVMTGGTFNVGQDAQGVGQRFFLVADFGSQATANITGGTINAGRFIVGSNGNAGISSFGTLNISNATINTDDPNTGVDFGYLGAGANVTIGAGTIINTPGRYRTGVFQGTGSTVVVQNGGTITSSVVVLGGDRPSTYTLNAGSLIGNNDFVVGDFNFAGPVTSNTPSNFIINGGVVSTGGRLGFGFTANNAHGAGTQTAGVVTCGGFILARANGAGNVSTYNMSGGSLTQTFTNGANPDSDFVVAQGDSSTGVFTHSGGDVSAQNIFLGDFNNSKATYTISGGTLNVATDMFVGSALAANAPFSAYINPTHITISNGQAAGVVALFDVVGHGASAINVGRDFLANPSDRSTNTTQTGTLNKATLQFDVGDAAGTTLIQVGNVADLDGAVIDIKTTGGFAPTRGETFNLFTANSFMMNGLTFAAEDGSNYSLALVPGGNGQILQATFSNALNLIWNQVNGTWDTNASNQPWVNAATSTPAPFTTGDTANFTDAAVGPVNVTPGGVTPAATIVSNSSGAYVFNGGGILGGSLTKANAGTLQLANSANTFSTATITAGTVVVGNTAGTASSPLTVTGALNVANSANIVLSRSTAGVGTNGGTIHSVGALNLNAAGLMDLNNNALKVGTTTPIATVRQYLQAGYSNGNWNGTSSATLGTGAITSTWAANDTGHHTALGYKAQPDGTTLVAATLYGDTNLKGSVGLSDYNILAANFNKSGVWATGDFDYDGTVGLSDYNKLAANFNKSAQPGGGVAAAPAAATAARPATLTGAASPAAAGPSFVDPGVGNVALEADPSTGKLYIVGDNSNISSYEVDSAAGKLTNASGRGVVSGYNTLATQSQAGISGSSLGAAEPFWNVISQGAPGSVLNFVAEGVTSGQAVTIDNIGPGLQAFDLNVSGLSAWTAGTPISDLKFQYGDGTGGTLSPAVIQIGVPEPTCLALAGIAAAGLLGRKRRQKIS